MTQLIQTRPMVMSTRTLDAYIADVKKFFRENGFRFHATNAISYSVPNYNYGHTARDFLGVKTLLPNRYTQ